MRNLQLIWDFPSKIHLPQDLQTVVGGSPLLSQALVRRGIQNTEQARAYLDPAYYQPAPPSELPGLELAVERLISAIQQNQTILVWGDFDVDGQTSTTLLSSGLKAVGADVYHYIPNRFTESHGVSPESLQARIREFTPALLLTCDTGIDAVPAVALASANGIDVIVTDHHQLPDQLPDALSIINPNLLPESHPLHDLPGVGVAYKLIEGLFQHFDQDPNGLLDLVALGIVADVAPLKGDNRYLLQSGLPELRNSPRLGLQMLYQLASINPAEINEETIGFGIGPRLNALGRLDDANSCVEFFTTQDQRRAADLAQKLENLNLQRQSLTEEIFQESLKMIEAYPELDDDYPVLVLQGSAQWHPGVIGIVASRLVERFNKPVIMLSRDGDHARGSARSVPGVPIAHLISQSSSLLTSHGGHPMAAGLSLPLENIAPFRLELKVNHDQIVGPEPDPQSIQIDAELPLESITTDFILDLNRLSPFGAGNPKLLFATRGVQIADDSIIGRKRNHRKLLLEDSAGSQHTFLWWNSADIRLPNKTIDIAYTLDITTFRDLTQPQATLKHVRESLGAPVYIPTIGSGPALFDFRESENPEQELFELVLDPSPTIWAEFIKPPNIRSTPRLHLEQSKTLVIWTSPPSQAELLNALDLVSPTQIFFFANIPDIHTVSKFIPKLLGLIKSAVEYPDRAYSPGLFAQAIAATPSLIEAGLDWIDLHGDYNLSAFKESNAVIEGEGENLPGFHEADQKLKYLLKETLSYRVYYQNSLLETLL